MTPGPMTPGMTAVQPRPATGSRRAGLAGLGVIVLGWEALGHLLGGTFLLAPPSAVVGYLVENHALMGRALAATLTNALAGFVLGNLAAIALAALALIWPAAQRVVTGVALVIFCLPLVATGPILRVLMGPGGLSPGGVSTSRSNGETRCRGMERSSGWLDSVVVGKGDALDRIS